MTRAIVRYCIVARRRNRFSARCRRCVGQRTRADFVRDGRTHCRFWRGAAFVQEGYTHSRFWRGLGAFAPNVLGQRVQCPGRHGDRNPTPG